MEDELVFKNEFDWDKRIDKNIKKEKMLNQVESFSMGMLFGAGGLFVFQLLLAIVDKL